MRLGFVGTGHIAEPMVRYLSDAGHAITVSRRGQDTARRLHSECGVAVADNQDVIEAADVVFLCLRPPVAAEVIPGLSFRRDQSVVSVMAGIGEADLRAICAPVTDFVQTLPVAFLDRGGCPLPAHGNAALLDALFGADNPVIPVAGEAALNAHFATAVLLPGMMDTMAHGAAWLAGRTGDADGAEAYVTQLVAGYFTALKKDRAGRLAEERDALATEGTLSLQMVDALRRAGVPDAFVAGFGAVERRLAGNADG